MLKAEDIWFRYSKERWILRGVSFAIDRGLHCIVGPNGCGKTTLIRIIIGGLRPQHGKIIAFGRRIKGIKDAVGLMVYVPSNPTMFLVGPRVRDDLYKASRDPNMSLSEIIDVLGLKDIMEKRIFELSEGQRHIVAVASAILYGTRIIVLDEPTIGLDRGYRSKIIEALRLVAKNRIIIVASNDLRFVKKCDTVMLLNDGKIVMHADPYDVLSSREFPFDDKLVRFINIMRKMGLPPKELSDDIVNLIRRALC